MIRPHITDKCDWCPMHCGEQWLTCYPDLADERWPAGPRVCPACSVGAGRALERGTARAIVQYLNSERG